MLVSMLRVQSPNDKQYSRVLNDELGPAPSQVPRKENRAIELKLYSRWETPAQDIQSALMDWHIRSIPHAAEKRPYNLAAIAEWAASTKDATLVRN
ncbi:hypothetical protein BDR03DRAFT_1092215 [Suillus americanus]|nr:hypothetical protein BDR03DRAFT_1092215 [Suillus americanus]